MIHQSRAIVLNSIRYSETSVIANMYTEAFGRQSYIINGIRSRQSKIKMGILQPLTLLDIEAFHKQGRDIQRIKELNIAVAYHSIPFEITKSTISLFISEILSKVLKQEEADQPLFDFLFESLQFFDRIKSGASNFHLLFLVLLTNYLGLKPNNNCSTETPWFDLKNGCFVANQPLYSKTPSLNVSKVFSNILLLNYENFGSFELNSTARNQQLELIVDYFVVHFENIGTIKSLQVLNEVFH